MTLLKHFPFERDNAAGNMARDAVMLRQCSPERTILWRFYGWIEPAVTFGYSQNWDWVCANTSGFEGVRIRRWTGGGIVDHREDLTYAVAIPDSHSHHRYPALELYRELHSLIADILNELGIESRLQPCPGKCDDFRPLPGGVCFQSAEPYDVISTSKGSKLAGAAMKRTQNGVLIQGSISLPDMKENLSRSIISAFGDNLQKWLHCSGSREANPLHQEDIQREKERFASPEWNRKR